MGTKSRLEHPRRIRRRGGSVCENPGARNLITILSRANHYCPGRCDLECRFMHFSHDIKPRDLCHIYNWLN